MFIVIAFAWMVQEPPDDGLRRAAELMERAVESLQDAWGGGRADGQPEKSPQDGLTRTVESQKETLAILDGLLKRLGEG